jgi:hypothetical protein
VAARRPPAPTGVSAGPVGPGRTQTLTPALHTPLEPHSNIAYSCDLLGDDSPEGLILQRESGDRALTVELASTKCC